MASTNAPAVTIPSESPAQSGTSPANSNPNLCRPSPQQSQDSSHGPVAILWDIENCPVPSDVHPEEVGGNIRMALRVHPIINGAVTMFSAYGDFNSFPRRLREGCQRTGVKLVDVPNGRKDAADKAILVDMFLFALDNPPPSSILLISGDVDFAPALHILGQRGYTVILVIPSGKVVSSALCNAGRFVWDWPSVARGEGFMPHHDISGYLVGCHISNNPDGQNGEEASVFRGTSQSYIKRDFLIPSSSLSEYHNAVNNMPSCSSTLRSQSLPSGLNEVSASSVAFCDQNDLMFVQPGDLNGLKQQLVKLLELSGGCLPLVRIPAEYMKLFGRPLYVSDYGAQKLVNLFKKMADAIAVEGKGNKRFVCIRNLRPEPSAPPVALDKKDKKGKRIQEENTDVIMGVPSSDEFSEEKLIGEQDESEAQSLDQFRYELQEILVSYSCRIFLEYFEAIYQQRYKRPLNYQRFRVNELEELLEKVKDVVALHEEPESKRKFLVPVHG